AGAVSGTLHSDAIRRYASASLLPGMPWLSATDGHDSWARRHCSVLKLSWASAQLTCSRVVDIVADIVEGHAIVLASDGGGDVTSLDVAKHGFGRALVRVAVASAPGAAHGIDVPWLEKERFLRVNWAAVHGHRGGSSWLAAKQPNRRVRDPIQAHADRDRLVCHRLHLEVRSQTAPLPSPPTRVGHKFLLKNQGGLLVLRPLHGDTRDVCWPPNGGYSIHIRPRTKSAVKEHDVDVAPPSVTQPHVSREMRRRAGFSDNAVGYGLSE